MQLRWQLALVSIAGQYPTKFRVQEISLIQILDPTHETTPAGVQRASRPASLSGKNVAFISNGKEGTVGFFKHLSTLLKQDYGVAQTRLLVKSNYSAPADAHIMESAKAFDAVITGLGD